MLLTLRLLAAAALAAVVGIHLAIASDYFPVGDRPFSLGDSFLVQSAVAVLLLLALLVRDRRPPWVAALVFGVLSLATLLLSRTVGIPVPGLPVRFQESWIPTSVATAAAEGLLIAAVATQLLLAGRRSTAMPDPPRADRTASRSASNVTLLTRLSGRTVTTGAWPTNLIMTDTPS